MTTDLLIHFDVDGFVATMFFSGSLLTLSASRVQLDLQWRKNVCQGYYSYYLLVHNTDWNFKSLKMFPKMFVIFLQLLFINKQYVFKSLKNVCQVFKANS